jgi:hypothetical protein
MLAHFLDVAMELARFEIIEDDGTFWGEVPGFQGGLGQTPDSRGVPARAA